MFPWLRQSLLVQLLGIYLIFASMVLGAGALVNSLVRQQLRAEAEIADLALAQSIALQTDTRVNVARTSLTALAGLDSVRQGDQEAMSVSFQAFKAARPDIDRVYWLDAVGRLQVSLPMYVRTLGTDFSEERVFLRAVDAKESFVEGGAVELTTFNAVCIIAAPVRDDANRMRGVLATNLLLDDFSAPLHTIVDQQARQNQRLRISMIDNHGTLIATQERERLLQSVADELPGAAEALGGQATSRIGRGASGEEWLFPSVPIPSVGWAVIVQRPASNVLAVANRFSIWLLLAALLFAAGGLVFWLLLLRRVIRPLHLLATEHRALPSSAPRPLPRTPRLARRGDEVGDLARSLQRLERDVDTRLAELRTLLETSKAVVGTLEPQTVIQTIIREVQRLVRVQAVAVLVPDETAALRVIASAGRSVDHDRTVLILPDDVLSPSALALRGGQPVQMLADGAGYFPPRSYAEGFRTLLAIPIISRHVGSVVLVVYRTRPEAFDSNDVDLLLTFANYATLAWEHAVLYERSDERLQAVARENERLYRETMQEKQTLTAVMRSMSDGLILTSPAGDVLFANPGASAITGLDRSALERSHIDVIQAQLQALARHQAGSEPARHRVQVLEIVRNQQQQVIELHQFDVGDEAGQPIGYGWLMRDITREHEVDQFKTTLLAAVGHELRTPLAAIKGHASTLLQEDVAWSPEDQQHFLQTISNEADRLAQMVTNLLDLSRFEAGLLPLQREVWSVGELVTRAVQRLGRSIPALDLRLDDDLPPVDVDGSRIEIVVRNLLANAIAYGEGQVSLLAARQHSGVVIRVSDNGPGIMPDDLPHVFERFYRAQRGVQRRSGGTGLGLAICKAFVEAHGGTIWSESSAMGTTMAFTLPGSGQSAKA
jgi:signal transduction histidine kinase/HAMP domain-containing protein